MKHLFLIGCIAAVAAGFFLIMGGKLLGVVFFVVGIGLGIVYNLDKKTMAQMQSDLAARKAAK